jgi:uncharacterized protein YneF (UPF0154 family)
MMSIVETYVHVLGVSLLIILLSGYFIYRYIKKKNNENT